LLLLLLLLLLLIGDDNSSGCETAHEADERASDDVVECDVDQRVEENVAVGRQQGDASD